MKNMKKIILLFICISIFVLPIRVFAEGTINLEDEKLAVRALEKYDIVRNVDEKWTPESYITRRDAIKMVYILKELSLGRPMRGYLFDDEKIAEMKETSRSQASYYSIPDMLCFTDIESGTDDERLVFSCIGWNLFKGRYTEEGLKACLDEYMTNEEAIIMMERMLSSGCLENAYFPYSSLENLLEEAGVSTDIIRLGNPEDSIKAYRYMRLIYDMFFVEYFVGDYGMAKYIYWVENVHKHNNPETEDFSD